MIKKAYEKYVLPKLLDACCSTKPVSYQRAKVVPKTPASISFENLFCIYIPLIQIYKYFLYSVPK